MLKAALIALDELHNGLNERLLKKSPQKNVIGYINI